LENASLASFKDKCPDSRGMMSLKKNFIVPLRSFKGVVFTRHVSNEFTVSAFHL